jgi:hypothetical protein
MLNSAPISGPHTLGLSCRNYGPATNVVNSGTFTVSYVDCSTYTTTPSCDSTNAGLNLINISPVLASAT